MFFGSELLSGKNYYAGALELFYLTKDRESKSAALRNVYSPYVPINVAEITRNLQKTSLLAGKVD